MFFNDFFFFQAEDGIRDHCVTGVQTCALPIYRHCRAGKSNHGIIVSDKKFIGFNKPYMVGKETDYIKEALLNQKISGDGIFTKKCHEFFQTKYGFKKVLLTTSCTDALEMAALLLDIRP